MNRRISPLFVLMLLVVMSADAFAGDKSLKLSGFVDAQYVFTRTKSGGDWKNSNTFLLYEFELDIEKRLSKNFLVRADMNYLANGPSPSDGLALLDHALEQAYVKAMIQFGKFELYAKLGKFNAPIGWESVDAPDKTEISPSLLFAHSTPTHVVGVLIGVAHEYFEIALYVVNGWDQLSDPNSDKTFGLAAGVTYEWFAFNVGVISGKGVGGMASALDAERLTVVDVNMTFSLLQKKIAIGIEGNVGLGSGGDAGGKKWWGAQLTFHYMPIKYFGFTLRYSYFRDKDGLKGIGAGTTEEGTIAIQTAPHKSVRFMLEYRADLTNGSIRMHTVGFQGVYMF